MNNRKEAFCLAIHYEIASQRLYEMLANSFESNPEIYNTFKHLIPMEKMHEEKLREVLAKEFPDFEPIIDDNYATDLDITDLNDPEKVLQFAISRENLAQKAYLTLAKDSSDPSLQQLFNELAQEEVNHQLVLENEILRIEGLITWYDPSELNGLVED
jgi:rubrerythrin